MEYINFTQAAKIAPGRPSANAVWRWARKGITARNGQRIKLQHVRQGGKLFTCREWLHAFGEQLAAADNEHFDTDIAGDVASGSDINAELERAGL